MLRKTDSCAMYDSCTELLSYYFNLILFLIFSSPYGALLTCRGNVWVLLVLFVRIIKKHKLHTLHNFTIIGIIEINLSCCVSYRWHVIYNMLFGCLFTSHGLHKCSLILYNRVGSQQKDTKRITLDMLRY
jgi:hypothetical protein